MTLTTSSMTSSKFKIRDGSPVKFEENAFFYKNPPRKSSLLTALVDFSAMWPVYIHYIIRNNLATKKQELSPAEAGARRLVLHKIRISVIKAVISTIYMHTARFRNSSIWGRAGAYCGVIIQETKNFPLWLRARYVTKKFQNFESAFLCCFTLK